MEMEIIVLGVSHYDMSSENGPKGASIKILGNSVTENNYCGIKVSESDIDFEEIDSVKKFQLPAVFKANVEMGSVKKNGSKKEVATFLFKNLKYVHSVEFVPVKKV